MRGYWESIQGSNFDISKTASISEIAHDVYLWLSPLWFILSLVFMLSLALAASEQIAIHSVSSLYVYLI